jgi:hypothetical protein
MAKVKPKEQQQPEIIKNRGEGRSLNSFGESRHIDEAMIVRMEAPKPWPPAPPPTQNPAGGNQTPPTSKDG